MKEKELKIREEDQNRKDIDLKVREEEQKQRELKEMNLAESEDEISREFDSKLEK